MSETEAPLEVFLRRIFLDEFQRVRKEPAPETEIVFYPYRGLTHTIRARNGRILIRISDLLVDAPQEILRSVVTILIGKLFRSPVSEGTKSSYRYFVSRPEFRKRVKRIRQLRGEKRLSSPLGQVFNLESIFHELNEVYFDNEISIRHLSWSPKAARTTLGHFDSAHEAIIINRRLDNPLVPRYVVTYVVYHEMLHALLGEEMTGNGRRVHHKRFREAEKRFPDYARAKAFIKDHSSRLSLD